MDRVIVLLGENLSEVERTGESRSVQRTSNLFSSVWRGDPALRHNIRQLKVMSDGLGAQCTKLALLALRSPTEEHFESLFSEIVPQVEAYRIQFVNFSNCSLSLPLLFIVCMPVRHFLKRMLELCETIKAASYEEVNALTGMVHECADAVGKVPETNKIAYKRAMMDKIAAVNDVINEFSKHVTIYKNKYGDNADSNSEDNKNRVDESFDDEVGDGNGGDDDDYDDDEGEYTEEEVVVAEKCLKLIEHTRNMMKVGVTVTSEIADALHPLSSDADESNAPEVASVFTSPSSSSEQRQCQEWVARVLREMELLENSTVDVGTELYAPLDNPEDVRAHYNTLFGKCAAFLHLLRDSNSTETEMLPEGITHALSMVSCVQLEFEEW